MRRWFPTLRSRLLVLVCLAALPGAILTVLSAVQERRDGMGRVREDVHRLADLAAGEEQHRLADVARQLTSLTSWPAIRARDTEACVARLGNLLSANPDYSWVAVADRTGHIFCASDATPAGESIAGHPAFQRALTSRAFAIGDAVSPAERAAAIEFSLPHADENRTIDFVVSAALQVRSLSIFAVRARLPAQAALLLLDGDGRVLVRAASARDAEGPVPSPTGPPETIPVRGAAAEQVHDPDGVTRFYAFSSLQDAAVPPMAVQLGVGFPRGLAFARADADLRRNLALLGTLALLALGMAWVGSERVVLRPLAALVGAAQQLAAGDLAARTGLVPGHDEVGRLATTFDQMAQALAIQTTQLAQREERFRALVERGSDLILLVDGNGIVLSAAPSSRRVLERAPEEFSGRGLAACVHPADLPHLLSTLAAVQHDPAQTALVAARYRHANGAWHWLEGAVKNLLAEPAVAAIVLNLRDVTARRQAEEESRQLTARLQRALEQLTALHSLTAALSHALDLAVVMTVVREHLERRWCVPVGAVYIYQAASDHLILTECWNPTAAVPAVCERIPAWDCAAACRIVRTAAVPAAQRHVSLPLVSGETLQGALDLWLPGDSAADDVQFAYFQAVAQQLSVAIEQARLFAEVKDARTALEAISRRLLEVQEKERRWIAQELHDEVGQMLTALHFMLESLRLTPAPDRAAPLAEAQRLTQELIRTVRHLSLDLRPSLLDDLGLVPALAYHVERYAEHTGITVTFEHQQADRRFAPLLETAAFRIIQEALTNVARHSRAARVLVRLWCDAATLHLQVEDAGIGFVAEAVGHASAGLSGMRERALLVDGDLVIAAVPGRGTRISAELPLPQLAMEASPAP